MAKDKIRPITACSFNCRNSAGFSASAFNKLMCNVTGNCYEICD